MPGKKGTARAARELEEQRRERVLAWIAFFKAEMAARLAETRRLLDEPVILFDIHTHSNHSDGRATVAANRQAAGEAGLDFMFATDHATLRHKRAVAGLEKTSWGQEPGAGGHHLGLLCPERLFTPRRDGIARDYARALGIAPFAWIPHPAGWYPRTTYTPERISELWTLGDTFAMEVLNGAHKIFGAWDRFDRAAVETWDRLLCDGRRVTALGGSDAHAPESIGTAWTAVPGKRAGAREIIAALARGNTQASEAPLLSLSVDGRPPGSVLKVAPGGKPAVSWRAADAGGLQEVALVSGGRVIERQTPSGATVATGKLRLDSGPGGYLRLQAVSIDGRHAFTSPVYLA